MDHTAKGNTVGSRHSPRIQDRAYIAGFLDGDGSIMVQIKQRRDTKRGWRIMVTICFYQDARHDGPLMWIRDVLGVGYISRRNDHITELRINGYQEAKYVLDLLSPYIRFKKDQARIALHILSLLCEKSIENMTKEERLLLVDHICNLRDRNYWSSQRKHTKESLRRLFEC